MIITIIGVNLVRVHGHIGNSLVVACVTPEIDFLLTYAP